MIGKSLSHYDIKTLLGKGGMGEVYRARDSKLDRDVALKLLPEEVSRDPERLARFQREAKLLASLSHPNVAAIYGLEEADGRVFLAMELAEGEDLSERIGRGPLPIDEAVGLALQIAEGLEAAHAKGIVHRDLKPANVMISEAGRVKLLDFGLARAYQGEEVGSDPAISPTITAAMTREGVILGTAAYMSPEQARGKPVDRQTDIWAFGVLLFEMLTGQQLFGGETVSDSIGAVLHLEPDWTLLPPNTPRRIRRLLQRCLKRERALRLRDIGDALVELRDEASDRESMTPQGSPGAPAARGPRRFLPWIVALASVVVAGVVLLTRGGGPEALPLRKLAILPISDRGEVSGPRISPDGKRIAYRRGEAIWIRDLNQTDPRRVSEARGFGSRVTSWSPDSRRLAFVNDDRLWRMSLDETSPSLIAEIPTEKRFIAGAWDGQDRIILAQWRGGLLEVSANGGTIRELMRAPDDLVDYHELSLLPDGKTLLGSAHLLGDSSRVDVIREGKLLRSVVLSEGFISSASYAPSGHILFQIDPGGIWAIPFSPAKLVETGERFVIDANGADPSPASDGSLVYLRNVDRRPGRLVRVDMSGKVVGTMGEPGEGFDSPLFSPSGSMLAYSQEEKGVRRLRVLDLRNGVSRRVTQFTGDEWPCAWSGDGRKLLVVYAPASDWSSPENGLYLADVPGGGAATRVSDGRWGQFLPDSSGVLYWKFGVRNDDRLEWKTWGRDAQPRRFLDSVHRAMWPELSPDGGAVAFESDDSGTQEIWAAGFPGGEGTVQLSRGGGGHPVWSRDGRSLYFLASDAVWQVPVTGGPGVRYGAPKRLFEAKPERLSLGAGIAVLPDGSGFVMVQRLPLEDAGMIYVQNWISEFQKRP